MKRRQTISNSKFMHSAALMIVVFFIAKILIDSIMDRPIDTNDMIYIHIWAAVLWLWIKTREEKVV